MDFERPRIGVSRCMEFEKCRYNENIISSETVCMLEPFVDYVKVCAESDIGMPTPRDPVRLECIDSEFRLIQPATGKDYTEPMIEFAREFLQKEKVFDGFILEKTSPSCSPKGARVHAKKGPMNNDLPKRGIFGNVVVESLPDIIIEDDGRLRNYAIREHFFTRIFTWARFRKVKEANSVKALVDFHTRCKYMLMGYNQSVLKKMGRIVANNDKRPASEVIEDYYELLIKAMDKLPEVSNSINVLQHIMGYFKNDLQSSEKEFFLKLIDDLRQQRVPLSVPVNILRSWVVRFGQEYLAEQYYFWPFPEELESVTDSGKGRKL